MRLGPFHVIAAPATATGRFEVDRRQLRRSVLWRLLAEQRKMQKRVSALKYNIIPAHDRTIYYIESTLEEEERITLFQMKVLHERAQG